MLTHFSVESDDVLPVAGTYLSRNKNVYSIGSNLEGGYVGASQTELLRVRLARLWLWQLRLWLYW
jgi:hypothetical protein